MARKTARVVFEVLLGKGRRWFYHEMAGGNIKNTSQANGYSRKSSAVRAALNEAMAEKGGAIVRVFSRDGSTYVEHEFAAE